MEVKQPKTYTQQVEMLRSRGCIIDDDCQCEIILKNVNYYRLIAYFLPFKQTDDTYLAGTNIERVYRIYEFDRRIRRVLFSVIEEIEIKLRTSLAYFHTHKYGALGYLDQSNFNGKHQHEKFKDKFEAEVRQNANVLFVKHHKEYYDGQFPFWVAVELFSFGMLSYFYADLKRVDQRALANAIYSLDADVLRSWLRCCTDLRNICAHYGRLYYRNFATTPRTPSGSRRIDNTLFGIATVLKGLYPYQERWNSEVLVTIETLIEEFAGSIKLNHIGFPDNWMDLLKA